MALDITIKTHGMEYVREALAKVGHFQRSNAVKKAWQTGGRYLMRQGRDSFRRHHEDLTGNLYKSFTYKVNKFNDGMHVGFGKGGNHAHLVDRGHELVVGKNRVKTGKRTKASLFWTEVRTTDVRPAGQMIGNQILAAYGEYLQTLANGCPNYSNRYY